jgi:outer membrane immunogenic protein
MKKILMAAVSLGALAIAAPASAADLGARVYTKAPAYVATVYDWSGLYIGVNGGWGQTNVQNTALGVDLGTDRASGGVVGGQIGYRWQLGSWVLGLEAQGDWANLRGSHSFTNGLFGDTFTSKLTAFGLFTGQVGYAWNTALLYVKGGAAVTSNTWDFDLAGTDFIRSQDVTRWGGSVGVGLEYAFAPNWSVAVEYDHLFMGKRDVDFYLVANNAIRGTANIGGDVDLVTARINYKFGGPVVARY